MRSIIQRSLASLLLVLPVAACDGWNTVETGAYGVIEFTPDDCGRGGCDLADPIAVGGVLTVTLEAVHADEDVAGLELISSDPGVVGVAPVYLGTYWSEWEVWGVGPGLADLIAVDGYGYEIDFTVVEVGFVERLHLDLRAGTAIGPAPSQPGFDEEWVVNAGAAVAFEVTPVQRGGEMLGRLSYEVVIDEVLFAGLEPGCRVEDGCLAFHVPAGDYPVSFIAPDGAVLDVLVTAR